MCFQSKYPILPISYLLLDCHLGSDTILSNTGLFALQELDRILMIFDISNTSNRFVISCQSKYVFRQLASDLNRSRDDLILVLPVVISLAICLELAERLSSHWCLIWCNLTQRPRTESAERRSRPFRICSLQHHGKLLQKDILSKASNRFLAGSYSQPSVNRAEPGSISAYVTSSTFGARSVPHR
jgi:hypothetical protein